MMDDILYWAMMLSFFVCNVVLFDCLGVPWVMWLAMGTISLVVAKSRALLSRSGVQNNRGAYAISQIDRLALEKTVRRMHNQKNQFRL